MGGRLKNTIGQGRRRFHPGTPGDTAGRVPADLSGQQDAVGGPAFAQLYRDPVEANANRNAVGPI